MSERDSVAQQPPEQVLLGVRLELAATIFADRDSQSCRTRSVNSSVLIVSFPLDSICPIVLNLFMKCASCPPFRRGSKLGLLAKRSNHRSLLEFGQRFGHDDDAVLPLWYWIRRVS